MENNRSLCRAYCFTRRRIFLHIKNGDSLNDISNIYYITLSQCHPYKCHGGITRHYRLTKPTFLTADGCLDKMDTNYKLQNENINTFDLFFISFQNKQCPPGTECVVKTIYPFSFTHRFGFKRPICTAGVYAA